MRVFIMSILGLGFGHDQNTPMDCNNVLGHYQQLASNYETCLTKSGAQAGQLAMFEKLITNGLSSQINAVQQEQTYVICKYITFQVVERALVFVKIDILVKIKILVKIDFYLKCSI